MHIKYAHYSVQERLEDGTSEICVSLLGRSRVHKYVKKTIKKTTKLQTKLKPKNIFFPNVSFLLSKKPNLS